MTIKEVLRNSKIDKTEAEILLAFVLQKDRSFIHAFAEKTLDKVQISAFNIFLKKRERNEPLAYILGFKEFYGRKFLVSKDVLIPRPETEELITIVIKFVGNKNLRVVDVGTGSGVIAVTLKLEKPNLTLFALDKSSACLKIARKNARLLGVENKIQFRSSDLLDNWSEKADVMVANLPYIPVKNWENLPAEIKDFEPRIALDSGKSKLSLYKKLFSQSKSKLNPGGRIFYEIDGKINRRFISADGKVKTL